MKRGPDGIELTASLYADLHWLTEARLAREQAPQTLQATALVHEAWLCLGGDKPRKWNDRRHYYRAVAEAMRHRRKTWSRP